jgi:hypothetical protein
LGSDIKDNNSSYRKTLLEKAKTVILSTALPSGNKVISLYLRQYSKVNKDENTIESGSKKERLTSILTLRLKNQRSRTLSLNGLCFIK